MAHYVGDAADISVLSVLNDNKQLDNQSLQSVDSDHSLVPGYISTFIQLGTGKLFYIFTFTRRMCV